MYKASFFGSFHAPRQRRAILCERRRAVLLVYVNAWRLQCAMKEITSVHQQREIIFSKVELGCAQFENTAVWEVSQNALDKCLTTKTVKPPIACSYRISRCYVSSIHNHIDVTLNLTWYLNFWLPLKHTLIEYGVNGVHIVWHSPT